MLVVTYNIQWGKGRDGRIDLARVARTVAGADIIALQEVERFWREQDFPDQVKRLSELLPDFHWVYGPAVDLAGRTRCGRRQFGNMTLSRRPITSTRTLPLPARPVEGHVNDQQSMIEAVTGAGSRQIRIYNTHLNYLSQDQRLDQIGRIMSFIAEAPERGGPITAPGKSALGPDDDWVVLPDGRFPEMPTAAILLGDFNMAPGTPEYDAIVRPKSVTPATCRLSDALTLAGLPENEGITFPGDGREPPQRLDHCFVSEELKTAVTRARIDGGADGSDHQPVWMELEV